MAGPGNERKPDAFLSYARLDDEVSDGYISWLRDRLEGQVNAEIGKGSFWIFQDTDEIPAGANWTSALEEALAGARFLIPVLSPSYFDSQPCLFELAKFHGFESSSGRKDLIVPIHFRDAPDHWDNPNNPYAALLRERQVFDWRSLRRKRRDDPEVLEAIERLAGDIRKALLRTSALARANKTSVTTITAPEALVTTMEELKELRTALDHAKAETQAAREDLLTKEAQHERDARLANTMLKDARRQVDNIQIEAQQKVDNLHAIIKRLESNLDRSHSIQKKEKDEITQRTNINDVKSNNRESVKVFLFQRIYIHALVITLPAILATFLFTSAIYSSFVVNPKANGSSESLAKVDPTAEKRSPDLEQALKAAAEEKSNLLAALKSKDTELEQQSETISSLGQRLNIALATNVDQISSYRSEFFGRLREALGDRPDLRVVGDRFVIQSEVLFASGSADIDVDGRGTLKKLADTVKSMLDQIPQDLPWVLQVEGHTDRIEISTPQFASNWALSAARAITVVQFLVKQDIPAERLAARGFAEFQPLDPADDEVAYRRNRRIEIKLTDT